MLGDLFNHIVRAVGNDSHAREGFVLSGGHCERFDVVATRRE